ncbi:hypothetical protein [Streptomyces sp. NPDC048196]|uniref:hypothetical protein n=1 Tax=Streptomyces sp. NPDC048196 TaxID=3154712 RepID=UPI0033D87D4B
MPITTTAHVLLTVPTPHGDPIHGDLGTISVPTNGTALPEPELRSALGNLLVAAGQYLLAGGHFPHPDTTPGVGESESPR